MGRRTPRAFAAAAGALAIATAVVVPTAVASAVSSPTITTVSPSSVSQGATKAPVTLGGTNFQSGAKVTSHSGITISTTFVSATQLDILVSVTPNEAPGAYNLILNNPDGGHFHCSGCLNVTGVNPPGSDWPAYLDGPLHNSYNSAATAITTSNVGQLAPAWRWNPPPEPKAPNNSTSLLASPTVVGGVVYQGVKDGDVCAVQESTAKQLWCTFLAINTPLPAGNPSCGVGDYQGIISTATVGNDPTTGKLTVYEYAPDGNLYALDAATGAVNWKSQIFVPSTSVNDYYSWGSPLVVNGKIYIGVSSDCDNPLINGGVASVDQSTGASIARWVDVPTATCQPPQTYSGCGGSVWSSPAEAADGSILVTTGNANSNGGAAQPLYNETIDRLDPNTLSVLDSWQIPQPPTTQDADFGASPSTWTAVLNGVSTPMVGACNKNGTFYAFKQSALSAGPVWQATVTVPYPGQAEECDAAATWDGTNLVVAGGAPTTINGTTYTGSVQSLNPATGVPIWQTGLNGTIVGSPTEDGSGVIAAPTYQSCPVPPTNTPCASGGGPSGQLGVYLISVTTGAIVGFIATPHSPLFGQAVFVGNQLLLGAGPNLGLTAYQVSNPGPAITGVSPSTLAQNSATNVTLTGSNFSGSPILTVSADGVTAGKVTVVSATKAQVKLTVASNASLGTRDLSLSIPGSPPTVDSCTACLTIAASTANPTITSVIPNSLAHGSSNNSVTVTGTNFVEGSKISSHNGITVATTYVSATQLDTSINVASTVAPGTYNVVVTNPGGATFNCKGCLTVT